MCRLALMNTAAITLLDAHLPALFAALELGMGGHGNGVAALWEETGQVTIRKGVSLTAEQAAHRTRAYARQGADWVLFHTRFATSNGRTSGKCHPFKSGRLVLAHNGHSRVWDELGRSIGMSDSECITQAWSRLCLPLRALEEVNGVFIGFRYGRPFVIKGDPRDDLVAALHEKTGALLFASELGEPFCNFFGSTRAIGRFLWYGGPLDFWKIEPRPRPTPQITLRVTVSPPDAKTQTLWAGDASSENASSSKSLADLRAWYQSKMQEMGQEAHDTSTSGSEAKDDPSLLQAENE